jgi:hypothetical protein
MKVNRIAIYQDWENMVNGCDDETLAKLDKQKTIEQFDLNIINAISAEYPNTMVEVIWDSRNTYGVDIEWSEFGENEIEDHNYQQFVESDIDYITSGVWDKQDFWVEL